MKVLLVHNRYQQRGGEDAVFENEMALLERRGVAVEAFELANDAIHSLRDRAAAFRRVTHNPGAVREVVERARDGRFDLVHIHNFFPLLSPAIHPALATAGLPVVQTLHNYRLLCANAMLMRQDRACELCLDHGPHHALFHRCFRGSLPGTLAVIRMQKAAIRNPGWVGSVSRFIALTAFARDKFVAAGLPADRIAVKPNSTPDPGPALPPEQRKGALFVGRIAPGKGVGPLLQAWNRLAELPLTVIGDGPDLADARRDAPADVHFTGALPREDVLGWMKRSSFLVMPSTWYEGFPVTIVEALACGLPVIASRIGGLPELVTNGKTGFCVPPGDAAGLARVVAQAFRQPESWPAWSRAARRSYEERYSQARNADQLVGIYDDAMSGRAL